MHDWVTMKFFDNLKTHVCMIESLWNFFYSLWTYMHDSITANFFLTALEHVYAWLNHNNFFLKTLDYIYLRLNHYKNFLTALKDIYAWLKQNEIFLIALEHIYAWLNKYDFFWQHFNTYIHDWVTTNFFLQLRTHI
jgi:hypothetical protein